MKNSTHMPERYIAVIAAIAAIILLSLSSTALTRAVGSADPQDSPSGREYCTVADDEIALRARPGNHTRITHRLGKTARVEYCGREGAWAKVVFRGDTCYAQLNSFDFSDKVKSTLPAWINLDETRGKWGAMGYYFSTDRIMEALPEFHFLKDRTPLDPGLCFDISIIILLITAVAYALVYDRIQYGNAWYWAFYTLTIILSVCELIYVFGSPDPLGFCDINNVWWPKAWFFVLLAAFALYHQLRLFSTILFCTQSDADFDFKAGLGVKILMLGAIYFIVTVVAYHFDWFLPARVNLIALIVLCVPLILMTYRACHDLKFKPLLTLVPFYLTVGAATLAIYCLVGMAVAVLAFIMLVIKLCGDDIVYVRYKGVWYYTDFETWEENRDLFSGHSFSPPTH